MRPLRHLKPRYIWDRLVEKRFRANHPGLPWLDPTAISLLETLLRREDCGLEFGSGRSTLWFSARTSTLTSIEHNREWYEQEKTLLAEKHCENVNLLHFPLDAMEEGIPVYARAAESFPAASLDYVLIDGVHRDFCASLSLDRIAPGGMLIIDNVHLYFPNQSRAPNAVPQDGQPVSKIWLEVFQQISNWRHIWTSNGISDTAIYFKPGGIRQTIV